MTRAQRHAMLRQSARRGDTITAVQVMAWAVLCRCSTRTIYRDLAALQRAGVTLPRFESGRR